MKEGLIVSYLEGGWEWGEIKINRQLISLNKEESLFAPLVIINYPTENSEKMRKSIKRYCFFFSHFCWFFLKKKHTIIMRCNRLEKLAGDINANLDILFGLNFNFSFKFICLFKRS